MLKNRLGVEAIEEKWNFPKKIRKYYKIPSTLIIPKECREIGVFAGCELKEVVIPEGIKRIGDHAFRNCKKLKKVVIPESVKIIEPEAFAWCYSLEKVVIPGGVKEIMRDAFRECRKAEITLYNSSTKLNVGDGAFWNCKSRRYVEKETRS